MANIDKQHIYNLKQLLAQPGYFYVASGSNGFSYPTPLDIELDKSGKVQAVWYGNFQLPFNTFVSINNGRKLTKQLPGIMGMELRND